MAVVEARVGGCRSRGIGPNDRDYFTFRVLPPVFIIVLEMKSHAESVAYLEQRGYDVVDLTDEERRLIAEEYG